MMDPKVTGAFIAECRKEKSITQKELGEMLYVTDRAVSKWETGRAFPNVTLLESLGEALGVSVNELLAGKRITPEEYRKEADEMLLVSLGKKHFLGLEIAFQVLELISGIWILLPIMILKEDFSLLAPVNLVCWGIALVMSRILHYIDRAVPGRSFRKSNIPIQTTSAIVTFLLIQFSVNRESVKFLALEYPGRLVGMLLGGCIVVGVGVAYGTKWRRGEE